MNWQNGVVPIKRNDQFKIYIAGSYSAYGIDFERNKRAGIKFCSALLKRSKGEIIPFCPWLDWAFLWFEPDLTVEEMYSYSMAWLEVSDAIFVLPNSGKSKGTQAEIKRAKELGIPVIYTTGDFENDLTKIAYTSREIIEGKEQIRKNPLTYADKNLTPNEWFFRKGKHE